MTAVFFGVHYFAHSENNEYQYCGLVPVDDD
jgi:hypothetical protein